MAEKRIRDIMTTGVISVTPEDNVKDAVDVMADRNISCVIVTESEDDKKPVGIITERDLVRRVLAEGKNPKKLEAKDIMTSSVVSISEAASLDEGLRVIESMKIRRLPVVNDEGLVGLITQTDIVAETHSIHSHNKKLTFHQSVQSYIIIGLAIVFVLAFIIRFWF